MVPKPKFDWQVKFEHGGKVVYANGNTLGASGESAIRGAVRESNLGRAEIALLANTVRVVKVDGNLKFNRDKGSQGSDIPSWYDSERQETTAERLLQHVITNIAPHLAEQYEDAFGVYFVDPAEAEFELSVEEGAENMDTNPTDRSPVGATASPSEEGI